MKTLGKFARKFYPRLKWFVSDLRKIPYVGKATEADLIALGYTNIDSLKGADPDEMYKRHIESGLGNDRCILYVYRMVCYFANTPNPDKSKLKWWLWKGQT